MSVDLTWGPHSTGGKEPVDLKSLTVSMDFSEMRNGEMEEEKGPSFLFISLYKVFYLLEHPFFIKRNLFKKSCFMSQILVLKNSLYMNL